ncbi:preprotein translocase subunit SecG [Paenibacillus rhizoplanae]
MDVGGGSEWISFFESGASDFFAVGLIAVVLLQKKGKVQVFPVPSPAVLSISSVKTKARGMELVLQRVTVGLAAGFFIMSIVVAIVVE